LTVLAFPKAGRAADSSQVNQPETLDTSSDGYWNNVRAQFALDPQIIHLNTGTEGAMPREIIINLSRYLTEFASNPMQAAALSEDFSYFQQKNRERIAAFTGARADEIVLTTNTTEGMNWIIQGLNLLEGDEVICTLHDHSAASSPLDVIHDRSGVTATYLALPSPASSKEEIVAIFEETITAATKVLCFSHINYTTGLRMPVRELCELAAGRGIITVVDGAHALGMLDINLHDLGCDFYSCAGHKWLNAPPGTGVLYIRDAEKNPWNVWPVVTEAYGYPLLSTVLQVRGQQNTPALKAMSDAMDFQETIGKSSIEARVLELSSCLKKKVGEVWGSQSLLSPESADLSTGITAFVPSTKPEDRYDSSFISGIVTGLRDQYKIYVRSVKFKDSASDTQPTYALRVSTHIFNSASEIDALIQSIQEIQAARENSASLSAMDRVGSEPLFVN
jgi:selenocysteine lyase/cysteine desulfurase